MSKREDKGADKTAMNKVQADEYKQREKVNYCRKLKTHVSSF